MVLLDIRLPGMDGLEVLQQIKALDEQVEVILVTAVKTVRTAVTAMKLGAFDYLTKPFEEEEVLAVVRRALDHRALQREVTFLRSELARRENADEIVGQSAEMRRLFQLIAQVARTSATVLITGESGTGKELVARAIHRQSPRRDKPFVPVNPAAISETLIESELFGHERGAFTGAYQKKLGRFELAQGGTLFLDEIATLKAELQVKLLRVLQEREIERVGGTRRIGLDVRIIAATNADLKRAVATQTSARTCTTGSTSCRSRSRRSASRRDDIAALGRPLHPASTTSSSASTSPACRPRPCAALEDYRLARQRAGAPEHHRALGGARRGSPHPGPRISPWRSCSGSATRADGERRSRPLGAALDQFERSLILRVLDRVRWNQSKAAAVLGLHRNTLLRKIAKWGLSRPEASDAPVPVQCTSAGA